MRLRFFVALATGIEFATVELPGEPGELARLPSGRGEAKLETRRGERQVTKDTIE